MYQAVRPSPSASVVRLGPKTKGPGERTRGLDLPIDRGLSSNRPAGPLDRLNHTVPSWPHDNVTPLGEVTGWAVKALSMAA